MRLHGSFAKRADRRILWQLLAAGGPSVAYAEDLSLGNMEFLYDTEPEGEEEGVGHLFLGENAYAAISRWSVQLIEQN